MIDFKTLYYITATISIVVVSSFIPGKSFKIYLELRTILVLLIISIYIVGMARIKGVDMDNYLYAFEYDPTLIPDFGFQYLMQLFSFFQFSFVDLMFLIAIINLFALKRLATHFKVSFGLLLILWFLHIAVVRDFAQLRSSLAISLAIIGFTSKINILKYLFYFISSTIHLTSIVFIIAYEVCVKTSRFRSNSIQWFLMGIFSLVILVGGISLQHLGFIDDRIDLYLEWDEDGYGTRVSSYGTILLHLFILILAIFSRKYWYGKVEIRSLFYLEILGLITFISLMNYQIFAFRLSNLILSLYPVFFLAIMKANVNDRNDNNKIIKNNFFPHIYQKLILIFFAILLIVRPGSLSIIERIGF